MWLGINIGSFIYNFYLVFTNKRKLRNTTCKLNYKKPKKSTRRHIYTREGRASHIFKKISWQNQNFKVCRKLGSFNFEYCRYAGRERMQIFIIKQVHGRFNVNGPKKKVNVKKGIFLWNVTDNKAIWIFWPFFKQLLEFGGVLA